MDGTKKIHMRIIMQQQEWC